MGPLFLMDDRLDACVIFFGSSWKDEAIELITDKVQHESHGTVIVAQVNPESRAVSNAGNAKGSAMIHIDQPNQQIIDARGESLADAIESFPQCNRYLIFRYCTDAIDSWNSAIKRLIWGREDLIIDDDLGCLSFSPSYSQYLLSSGQEPSLENARLNGFSTRIISNNLGLSWWNQIKGNRTFLKFLLVGSIGAVVQIVSLAFLNMTLSRFLSNGIYFLEPIAVEISIICNFFLNDSYTFKNSTDSTLNSDADNKPRPKAIRFSRYNLVSLGSFGLNWLVFSILVSTHLWYISSNIAAIVVSFGINYLGSTRWAWGMTKKREPVQTTTINR